MLTLTNLSLGYLVGGQNEINRWVVVARHVQDRRCRRCRVHSEGEPFLAAGDFDNAYVRALATL